MIRVRIDTESMELKMDGHAGAERIQDHDLVCCAASMMVYALAATMAEQNKHGKLREMRQELECGHALIQVTPKTDEWMQVMARFETITDGLCLLAKKYPDNIRIEFE